MIRPPYLARVAVGAAVYALEETRKLPSTAVTLPMTAISQMLQTTMHFQQFVTSLAIKGDRVLGDIYSDTQEQPEWATFDEDADDTSDAAAERPSTPGRFALYSMPQPAAAATAVGSSPQKSSTPAQPAVEKQPAATPKQPPAAPEVDEPEIAQYLDYSSLTLAQLRARLRSLSTAELSELLDFEKATRARAPFQTMLANRIAAAQAK